MKRNLTRAFTKHCYEGASSGTVDTCYLKNKLWYCAGTTTLNKTCRYSGAAWGLFIGLPAVLVIVAVVVGVVIVKKRNSSSE